MLHLLDTNIFIEAKNRYYGTDFCPAFWDWLDHAHQAEKIASISLVQNELVEGDDELKDWARERANTSWFIDVDDDETQEKFSEISRFVMAGEYKPEAKAEFLDKADPWLIAKAYHINAVVVTHERHHQDGIKKRVPIPNVCRNFNIPYIDTFDLLREHSANFVLR